MSWRIRLVGVAALVLMAACNKPADQPVAAAPPGPAPGTPEWKIRSAMSAAPDSITAGATIMDYPASPTAQMTQLRAGTNGWLCVPDMPMTPGPDPLCGDAQWQTWLTAWMAHRTPNLTAIGVAYMLAGGSDGSNTNPYAEHPDSGQAWITSGPHLMVLSPNPHAYDAMPNTPNNSTPYVMFKGTPFAHLMVPVGVRTM
jgi:hypothetical protein